MFKEQIWKSEHMYEKRRKRRNIFNSRRVWEAFDMPENKHD